MGQKVLGLDLSKVTMPEAIAAMVEAWLDAQGVKEDTGVTSIEKAYEFGDEDEKRVILWLKGLRDNMIPAEFTTNECLCGAGVLGLIDRAMEMKAAKLLKSLGYVKSGIKRRNDGSRVRLWSQSNP